MSEERRANSPDDETPMVDFSRDAIITSQDGMLSLKVLRCSVRHYRKLPVSILNGIYCWLIC